MATPPIARLRRRVTYRIIPSRYPSVGILDRVTDEDDLQAVFELEAWTNDRISNELGLLLRIPRDEWVIGQPMATVIMAAYCHPRPGGGRFNDGDRGAWYAGFTLDTAHAEVAYHRGRELSEVGVTDARLEMRSYVAEFTGAFHDVREAGREYGAIYDPSNYAASQRLAAHLRAEGSNGIVYRSVRHASGTCLVCFRPALVGHVRIDGHFEYRWTGAAAPVIRRLGSGRAAGSDADN